MHVSLHQAFKGYLDARPEENLYNDVLTGIGLTSDDFEAEAYHDDDEMQRAVEFVAGHLSATRMDFLTGWGVAIAQGLLDSYESAIEADWKLLDLLEHIESRMHVHSREEFGARPPVLVTERINNSSLRIDVETSKQMTGLAKGFVLGFADSFGEQVDLVVNERDDGFTFHVTTSG